ncbi:MAG: sugar ABC transporter substrate-binding protein [Cyanobacteria bacterium SIG32]|nr:sugar ABC transporter substrate-binding protein [Cyanobacteria bacterium SIG32]
MKKVCFIVFSLILVLILGSFILSNNKNKTDNEVVFWTLQMSDFSPYINGVIENFENQNPDIKIKWIDVPFSEGEKRTLASVLSNNPPDLVNLNPDFSAILAQKGALQEIPEEMTQQYLPEIINSLKFNDKIYSLPWYATSAITIYNKNLFNQANAKVPKNYNELKTIASQIKTRTNAYVFLPNLSENDTMLKILNKYGVNSSNTINSPKSVEIFEFFKYLYTNDLIPKESITQTHREALEKYMSENIAMFQAGANFLNMIKENAPTTYAHTDVAPQLVGDIGQNDFSLMNFVIPLRAKHKEDALKFALFLTNEENQLELAKLTNILAVNQKTLKNEFYTKYDSKDLMSKARVISAKQLNKIQPVLKSERNQKEINTLINSAVQEILLNKAETQSILDRVSKNWKMLNSDNKNHQI